MSKLTILLPFLDEVEAALDRDDDNTIADLKAAAAAYREKAAKLAEPCPSSIYAGPGHQSRHECIRETERPHHHHRSRLYGYEWSDCQAEKVSWSDQPQTFTDIVDRSPGECGRHDDEGRSY